MRRFLIFQKGYQGTEITEFRFILSAFIYGHFQMILNFFVCYLKVKRVFGGEINILKYLYFYS